MKYYSYNKKINLLSETKKFFLHLRKQYNNNIGVAVSGGLDSMVLLHLLLNIFDKLEVIHCNFNLRNYASNEDELFVHNFCKNNDIICHIKKFNVSKKKIFLLKC